MEIRNSQIAEPEAAEASEQHMVERCIDGEKDAWESLFHRYQPRLLALIKRYLGSQADCSDLDAEEIAASIWFSLLVSERFRLRRFDPSRGTKLLTWLAALAKREIWTRYRREQSRRSRENRAARTETTSGDDSLSNLLLQEFLETLTPREREFCLNYLLTTREESEALEVSASNAWKLRSRVMRKLRLFSGEQTLTDRDINEQL